MLPDPVPLVAEADTGQFPAIVDDERCQRLRAGHCGPERPRPARDRRRRLGERAGAAFDDLVGQERVVDQLSRAAAARPAPRGEPALRA